jgi:hypothetical protein
MGDGFPAGAQRRRGGVVRGGYSLRPSVSAGGSRREVARGGDGFPAGAQRRRGGRCLRWVFPASPRLCGRFPSGGGARRGRFSRRGAGAQRGDEPLLSWLSNCPSPLRTVSTDSKPFGRACRSIRRETWKRRRGEASGPCPSVKSVESVVNPPPYPDSAVPRGGDGTVFPQGRRGAEKQGRVWGSVVAWGWFRHPGDPRGSRG